MTKNELIKEVTERTGVTREVVECVIDTFISSIKNHVENGERIMLREFASFQMKEKKAYYATNIHARERMLVPASREPSIRVSVVWRAEVIKKSRNEEKTLLAELEG